MIGGGLSELSSAKASLDEYGEEEEEDEAVNRTRAGNRTVIRRKKKKKKKKKSNRNSTIIAEEVPLDDDFFGNKKDQLPVLQELPEAEINTKRGSEEEQIDKMASDPNVAPTIQNQG